MALQVNRQVRALELATTLLLPKSLGVAIKLAERNKKPRLAERMALVLKAKEQRMLALAQERELVDRPTYAQPPPPPPAPECFSPAKPAAEPELLINRPKTTKVGPWRWVL